MAGSSWSACRALCRSPESKRFQRGPRLGAVSLAPLTCLEARHRDDALATLDRIEEVDLDLHPQVGAPHRAARLATAEVTAKERLEEIADAEVADPARR